MSEEKRTDFEELEDAIQVVIDKVAIIARIYKDRQIRRSWAEFAGSVHAGGERRLWRALDAFYEEYKTMTGRGASLAEIDEFIRSCFEPSEEEGFLEGVGRVITKLVEEAVS